MGSVRKEIKWNRYWYWAALWEYEYSTTKSWRRLLMEKCRCDCWVEKFVQRSHLLNWASTNCWCIKDQKTAERSRIQNRKHWMEWTTPYRKFMSAKARCTRENNDSYYRYWWRWIKFEWANFADFWKDMWESYKEHCEKYWEKDTTLERINVDGNYCKENCIRATRQEQYENKSDNHKVTYKWKEYPTIAKMCRELWKKYWLVRDRIRDGWSVEDAVEKPLFHNSVNYGERTRGESPSPHTLNQNDEQATSRT